MCVSRYSCSFTDSKIKVYPPRLSNIISNGRDQTYIPYSYYNILIHVNLIPYLFLFTLILIHVTLFIHFIPLFIFIRIFLLNLNFRHIFPFESSFLVNNSHAFYVFILMEGGVFSFDKANKMTLVNLVEE